MARFFTARGCSGDTEQGSTCGVCGNPKLMNGFDALRRMAENLDVRMIREAMPQVIFGFNGIREVSVLSVRHVSDIQWRNCALLLEDLMADDWHDDEPLDHVKRRLEHFKSPKCCLGRGPSDLCLSCRSWDGVKRWA